ncbi:MAG: glycosyltransferase family 4 protein [Polyangia bacterium]
MYRHFPTRGRSRGIAFIGNYPPRRCGIATFTHDLAEAVSDQAGADQPVIVAAMNDTPQGYDYPERVRFEIRQDYQLDYSRAADFLNFSRIDVVCLQHEFGIFGGKWGRNLLALLHDLRRPLVVTCHTVQRSPHPEQREMLCEIAAVADRLVVMGSIAVDFLEDVYGIDRGKVAVIPHGIHDVPFVDPSYYKDKFGVEGRKVLMTFGLLHRNKGVEYMIEALPAIVKRHPNAIYVVLGATHPGVLREEGESYRLSLQRLARDLGVEGHLLFHPRFVDNDELFEYLGATDIFVTPYLFEDQITSGVLAYAVGSGKAVVSTGYWHARELLDEQRGRLVPMADSEALAREVNSLLDDEVTGSAMRKRAYTHSRSMVWPMVARSYLELFEQARSRGPLVVPTATSLQRTIAATNLPQPKLDHMLRLSDDTGPCHHSRYTVPDWSYGYHLEDAAAALVVGSKFHDTFGEEEAARYAEVCLALIQLLVGDGTRVQGALDYSRRTVAAASPEEIGRALWAVGYVVWRGPGWLEKAAHDLFQVLMQTTDVEMPRAAAYAVLGATNYLRRLPGASQVRRFLTRGAASLERFCDKDEWIDRWTNPDWPVAVQALAVAGRTLEQQRLRDCADELAQSLLERTRGGSFFARRAGEDQDEQPAVAAAAFIEALGAVYESRRDPGLLDSIRVAADWFLGANGEGEALYDFTTGGCHDAITASGRNMNQGPEATSFCLLAFLSLHRIAAIDAGKATRE